MIDDLKRDSTRWRQDQDRRSRTGRSTGTPDSHRIPPSQGSNGFGSVSYAEMKGRQEADFGDSMEVDDYPYEPAPRHHDIDPRDARHMSSRHPQIPVSSAGYPSEPPHPAYSIAPGQQGKYSAEGIPRYGGGNTPPTTRTMAPGYSQSGYARTSAATAPPIPSGAYRDPRTGQIVSGYDTGYPEQGRSRHGGR
jgi:hypothetical protein